MKKIIVLITLIFLIGPIGYSKNYGILDPADSLNKKRIVWVSVTGATAWVGSISALHFVWYKDFEKIKFAGDIPDIISKPRVSSSFSSVTVLLKPITPVTRIINKFMYEIKLR